MPTNCLCPGSRTHQLKVAGHRALAHISLSFQWLLEGVVLSQSANTSEQVVHALSREADPTIPPASPPHPLTPGLDLTQKLLPPRQWTLPSASQLAPALLDVALLRAFPGPDSVVDKCSALDVLLALKDSMAWSMCCHSTRWCRPQTHGISSLIPCFPPLRPHPCCPCPPAQTSWQ